MNSSPRSQCSMTLFAAGLVVLLATTCVSEILTAGLNNPEALARSASRLDQIPETIGNWHSVPRELSEREQRLAQISHFVRREYRHEETGYAVVLTVLCGPAGPMSVHPPTSCFEGVGYELASGPNLVTMDNGARSASFNRAVFRPPQSMHSEVVRVFWAWSTDGQWDAPPNPRIAYRGEPALYKLYVVEQAVESVSDLEQAEAFLADALPVIQEALRQ